ncbi:hypothetical protein TI39_contig354g00063 [Zymoseptoria brevis]|uniref:Bacteriophage T5 Orf172 DNA-binding domain-containing protein n=1 Tax=Zymoseptoria brevis TaxID=1047168 RepID=A0A0F4GTK7_9PEZI|nr:hypothetical protein TI39_contig354g00063 [Zymoseptoria brevis]
MSPFHRSAPSPESLMSRSDSKNPASTCQGLTSAGRPCRRALALSMNKRPSNAGVVAVGEEAADFYCWQHKDQATNNAVHAVEPGQGRPGRHDTEIFELKGKSSIDTLVQRLGIAALTDEEDSSGKKRPKSKKTGGLGKVDGRTQTTDYAVQQQPAPYGEKYGLGQGFKTRPQKKKRGFWASLCCGAADSDQIEIVRHRKRLEQASHAPKPAAKPTNYQSPRPSAQSQQQKHSSNPQTDRLLSLLPPHLSPQTTAALLAELLKPISAADEEGYIYIFWLTPQDAAAPGTSTARSLLSPPKDQRRRVSAVMSEYGGESARGGAGQHNQDKTIMLKIGRANNVSRRMKEWQKQCGYALNLVRWYPYMPSSNSSSPCPSPRTSATPGESSPAPEDIGRDVKKVKFVKRVERLVHLELNEQRVMKECEACGRTHQEWFRVDASQEGVRRVDECVRRWVKWAESQAN